jgi:hypothetical protein
MQHGNQPFWARLQLLARLTLNAGKHAGNSVPLSPLRQTGRALHQHRHSLRLSTAPLPLAAAMGASTRCGRRIRDAAACPAD